MKQTFGLCWQLVKFAFSRNILQMFILLIHKKLTAGIFRIEKTTGIKLNLISFELPSLKTAEANKMDIFVVFLDETSTSLHNQGENTKSNNY